VQGLEEEGLSDYEINLIIKKMEGTNHKVDEGNGNNNDKDQLVPSAEHAPIYANRDEAGGSDYGKGKPASSAQSSEHVEPEQMHIKPIIPEEQEHSDNTENMEDKDGNAIPAQPATGPTKSTDLAYMTQAEIPETVAKPEPMDVEPNSPEEQEHPDNREDMKGADNTSVDGSFVLEMKNRQNQKRNSDAILSKSMARKAHNKVAETMKRKKGNVNTENMVQTKQHDHDKDRSAKPENPAEPNQFGDNSGSKKNRGHNYGQMHKHSHEHVHQHVHKHVHVHPPQHTFNTYTHFHNYPDNSKKLRFVQIQKEPYNHTSKFTLTLNSKLMKFVSDKSMTILNSQGIHQRGYVSKCQALFDDKAPNIKILSMLESISKHAKSCLNKKISNAAHSECIEMENEINLLQEWTVYRYHECPVEVMEFCQKYNK
jgi:hypothetical protein